MILDLQPDDNNYYVCMARSGENWVAFSPSPDDKLGRLSVWFAPPSAGPPPLNGVSDSAGCESEDKWKVRYGLAHQPSRLECRAMGQPPPQWTWTGPPIPNSIEPVSNGEVMETDM